jgi:alpha-1,3-glucosyltransferase
MSQAAASIDPAMLVVKNLGYDSWQTVYFQRATVILTELVLVFALSRYDTFPHDMLSSVDC